GAGRALGLTRLVRRAERGLLLVTERGPRAVGRLRGQGHALLLEARLERVGLLLQRRLLIGREHRVLRGEGGHHGGADTEADHERGAGHEQDARGLPHGRRASISPGHGSPGHGSLTGSASYEVPTLCARRL